MTDDGYEGYRCERCGVMKLVKLITGEKNENCEYDVTTVLIYRQNGRELYRHEIIRTYEEHDYEYRFEMEGDNCKDGYMVFYTCKACGFTSESHYGFHHSFPLFELNEDHGVCEEHYLNFSKCPCGEQFEFNFDSYNFEYDENTQTYTCQDCALKVTVAVNDVENGCSLDRSTTYVVAIGDEELYYYIAEKTYSNHSYTDISASSPTVTITCDKCGDKKSADIASVKVEEQDNGRYGELTFTPEVSDNFTFRICDEFYLMSGLGRIIVFELIDGEYVDIAEGFAEITTELTAGSTYLFRIYGEGYDHDGDGDLDDQELAVMITQGEMGYYYDASCEHKTISFAVLTAGAESCLDGVAHGQICVVCGMIDRIAISKRHVRVTQEIIDLTEYGACHGEVICYSCACGQMSSVEENSCAGETSTNEYYDEDGHLVTHMTRTCPKCGLRYDRSYYAVKDSDACRESLYYTVTVTIGSTAVFEKEYTVVRVAHDYEITATLINGKGSSCEDGVVITHKCKVCGYETSKEYDYHTEYEKERIELAEKGSVCGGYASVYGCACGRYTHMTIDHSLCEFDQVWCKSWIEGAIEGDTVNGYFYNDAYIYTCAVTDPERCAYKIRYATYWLKAADECRVYEYQTWQFGYNVKLESISMR